jgi:hypothetical protein
MPITCSLGWHSILWYHPMKASILLPETHGGAQRDLITLCNMAFNKVGIQQLVYNRGTTLSNILGFVNESLN